MRSLKDWLSWTLDAAHELRKKILEEKSWLLGDHITCSTSSSRSKKASLFCSTSTRPNPMTTVRISSGSFVAILLAIWAAYRWPTVSRSSPPAPNNVFGVRCSNGRRSPSDGNAVSKLVGDAVFKATWIYGWLEPRARDHVRNKPIAIVYQLVRLWSRSCQRRMLM